MSTRVRVSAAISIYFHMSRLLPSLRLTLVTPAMRAQRIAVRVRRGLLLLTNTSTSTDAYAAGISGVDRIRLGVGGV
ncbi:hypothetical protein F5Y10DRAFT_250052 [Nemania abortiva]|nr:hypothetical protein F5Y10DRAFT_250052 [Nemania abortiva]